MPTSIRDTKERFTDRVDDYVRARPGYPRALVDDLAAAEVLSPGAVVADVGSGTGISTELFLAAGYEVVGIEPNAPMRTAAENSLAKYPRFRSLPGSAEATGLADASVDLVVAAQAFHWFDVARARAEFRRILRPGGAVALVWNARRAAGTPFLEGYEKLLLDHGTDYRLVGHRGIGPDRLAAFFGGPYETRRGENFQDLDLDGLRARLLSSSYVPAAGKPGHDAILAGLADLFERHQHAGRVRLEYDVDLFLGPLGEAGDQATP